MKLARTLTKKCLPAAVLVMLVSTAACQKAAGKNPSSIDMLLRSMSRREKLGQLFMLAFDGTRVTPRMRAWIRERNIGGIALFGKNARSHRQLQHLTQSLQALARKNRHPIPLFLATDHEPGSFMAIRLGHTFPNARSLRNKPDALVPMARQMAADLRRWGLNMNFYPVVDIDRADSRSPVGYRCLGQRPETVTRGALKICREFRARGIIPVAKHFPGHGDTRVDSHHRMPVITKKLPALLKHELVPYRRLIGDRLPVVMAAHIRYPALDISRPAALSRPILRGLLRRRLGFQGIVITDDLAMGAIIRHYSLRRACFLALKAGVDILLITRRFRHVDSPEIVYAYLEQQIRKKRLPLATVNRSLRRILQIKMEYRLLRH